MSRRRRDVLLGAAAVAVAAGKLPTPAIAQGIRELKLVTSWPKGSLGLQTSAERLAESITLLSDGRLKITVYPGNTLVHPFEVFDAVGAGVADMYHATDVLFREPKSLALYFFCRGTVRHDRGRAEFLARLRRRTGIVGRGRHTIQYQAVDGPQYGYQMGGWFTREVNSPGLTSRGCATACQVSAPRCCAAWAPTVVLLPGSDIVNAIKSGSIDASEWVGPWIDMDLGLHKVADYYYYPGFHEPGSSCTLGINKTLWDGLTARSAR